MAYRSIFTSLLLQLTRKPCLEHDGYTMSRTSELDVIRSARLCWTLYCRAQWPDPTTFGVLQNPTHKDHDPQKLNDVAAPLEIKLDRQAVNPGADRDQNHQCHQSGFPVLAKEGDQEFSSPPIRSFNDLRQDVIVQRKTMVLRRYTNGQIRRRGRLRELWNEPPETYEQAAVIAVSFSMARLHRKHSGCAADQHRAVRQPKNRPAAWP